MTNQCFANINNRCKVLKVNNCDEPSSCSFYKTKEDCEKGRKMVYERLNSLSSFRQRTLADQYYQGRYPWRKEDGSYDK